MIRLPSAGGAMSWVDDVVAFVIVSGVRGADANGGEKGGDGHHAHRGAQDVQAARVDD